MTVNVSVLAGSVAVTAAAAARRAACVGVYVNAPVVPLMPTLPLVVEFRGGVCDGVVLGVGTLDRTGDHTGGRIRGAHSEIHNWGGVLAQDGHRNVFIAAPLCQ